MSLSSVAPGGSAAARVLAAPALPEEAIGIEEYTKNDVLFGRGSSANQRKGPFMTMVWTYADYYKSLPDVRKGPFARSIVDYLHKRGTRFYQLLQGTQSMVLVRPEYAAQKLQSSIRDYFNRLAKTNPAAPPPVTLAARDSVSGEATAFPRASNADEEKDEVTPTDALVGAGEEDDDHFVDGILEWSFTEEQHEVTNEVDALIGAGEEEDDHLMEFIQEQFFSGND
jgi:hypothetical protein